MTKETLMTKERPILFSGAMVRAILDGKKTQTRRVLKRPRWAIGIDFERGPQLNGYPYAIGYDGNGQPYQEWCPYGQPGDRLWVRETWRPVGPWECRDDGATIQYRADGAYIRKVGWPESFRVKTSDSRERFYPSIHMPRWASRITLEIVSVRVERLQDISEGDALAEGSFLRRCPCMPRRADKTPMDMAFRQTGCHIHGHEFFHLWDSINGKRPGCAVADNPWVWAIEFKRANP